LNPKFSIELEILNAILNSATPTTLFALIILTP
jgi:hypothetical protein